MCLILMAYRKHPEFPLIVVANRDEFYARPTAIATIWPDQSGIVAGRDLRARGTWLGVTASGRFAAVTNYRGDETAVITSTSRGSLVAGFLRSEQEAEPYLSALISGAAVYQGYNLLAFDGENLVYASNRGSDRLQRLRPGFYGLSNQHLDTPWPKVKKGRETLQRLVRKDAVSSDDLLTIMTDVEQAGDSDLPDTGIPLKLERQLSSTFIRADGYGTRCTTVVEYSRTGEIEFVERSHGLYGEETITQRFQFAHSSALSYPCSL